MRIATTSSSVVRRLKRRGAELTPPGEAPLGFVLDRVGGMSRRFRLLERGGNAVATSWTSGPVCRTMVTMLDGLGPVPPGMVRIRARAILGESSVVLLLHPLPYLPRIDSSDVAEGGFRMVDHLVVDVNEEGYVSVPGSVDQTRRRGGHPRGHVAGWSGTMPIGRVVVSPVAEVDSTPVRVMRLALDAVGGEVEDILHHCARVATSVPWDTIDSAARLRDLSSE